MGQGAADGATTIAGHDLDFEQFEELVCSSRSASVRSAADVWAMRSRRAGPEVLHVVRFVLVRPPYTRRALQRAALWWRYGLLIVSCSWFPMSCSMSAWRYLGLTLQESLLMALDVAAAVVAVVPTLMLTTEASTTPGKRDGS